jgi:hypothetical protein
MSAGEANLVALIRPLEREQPGSRMHALTKLRDSDAHVGTLSIQITRLFEL